MTDSTASHSVESKLRDFIAQNMLYSPDGFSYSDDASFLQEGIVDSLGVMQLVEFVQKDFHVTVDQPDVTPENFDSIARLAGFVRRKLQTQTPSAPGAS
jgi:acyl carrier protein